MRGPEAELRQSLLDDDDDDNDDDGGGGDDGDGDGDSGNDDGSLKSLDDQKRSFRCALGDSDAGELR